jgi:hypothetical protein
MHSASADGLPIWRCSSIALPTKHWSNVNIILLCRENVLGLGCWFFLIKGVVRFLTYDAFGANVKLYMQTLCSDWSGCHVLLGLNRAWGWSRKSPLESHYLANRENGSWIGDFKLGGRLLQLIAILSGLQLVIYFGSLVTVPRYWMPHP